MHSAVEEVKLLSQQAAVEEEVLETTNDENYKVEQKNWKRTIHFNVFRHHLTWAGEFGPLATNTDL